MAEESYPWDDVLVGDATLAPYDDDVWSDIWRTLFTKDPSTQGVIKGHLNELLVSGTTSPITIETGAAMVDGKVYDNDAALSFPIPLPTTNRIDFIVLRKRWATQTVRVTRVAGFEGGGAPAITQMDGNIWDIPLAQININSTGTIIVSDYRNYLTGQSLEIDPSKCNGRLTLTSGTPVTMADVSDATTIYFTPYKGSLLSLYDGANWNTNIFSEISLSLLALNKNHVYDLFVYTAGGLAFAIEPVAWSSPSTAGITSISNASPRVATTSNTSGLVIGDLVTIEGNTVGTNNVTWRVGTVVLNTSFVLLNLDGTNSGAPGAIGVVGTWQQKFDTTMARVTGLTMVDGVYLKSGQLSRRYIGTILIDDIAARTQDKLSARYVWNYYNRISRTEFVTDTTATAVSTGTWLMYNNDMANIMPCIVGVQDSNVLSVLSVETNGSASATALLYGTDMQFLLGTVSTMEMYNGMNHNTVAQAKMLTQIMTQSLSAGFYTFFPAYNSASVLWLWLKMHAAVTQLQ